MGNKTVLYQTHEALGAKIVNFAGWDMPLHYGSQINEHLCVREDAGLFDVSHMAIIAVTGNEAEDFLSRLLANSILKLSAPGRALYSCLLDQAGCVLDDLIAYYWDVNHYYLVVNAATTDKDLHWLTTQAKNYDIKLSHLTDYGIIAVQGPCAREKAASALKNNATLSDQILQLKPFHCCKVGNWLIARTGYTGEDGIEILLPVSDSETCWKELQQQDIQAIGLGARDTLRLEAGFNLYGQDMDESVSPLESNLAWTVPLDEERHFIGKEALLQQKKQGISRQLVGLVLEERGILRHGQKIYQGDNCVGEITSGSYSPTAKCSLGLARIMLPIQPSYKVDIRGKLHSVTVVKPPFVRKGQITFGES